MSLHCPHFYIGRGSLQCPHFLPRKRNSYKRTAIRKSKIFAAIGPIAVWPFRYDLSKSGMVFLTKKHLCELTGSKPNINPHILTIDKIHNSRGAMLFFSRRVRFSCHLNGSLASFYFRLSENVLGFNWIHRIQPFLQYPY